MIEGDNTKISRNTMLLIEITKREIVNSYLSINFLHYFHQLSVLNNGENI